MNPPRLLILKELLKPIDDAFPIIDISINEIEKTSSNIVEKSVFSYVVSLYETVLTEILVIIFKAFPEKILRNDFTITKDKLFGEFLLQVPDEEIDKYIIKLSYENLQKYMRNFYDFLSIEILDQEQINYLIEIKETRNLLLHNNLQVNTTYQFKAGPKKREPNLKGLIPLDKPYILQSFNTIKNAISHIECGLKSKYAKYDKCYVLKSVWNYVFDSPVLKFDDYWECSNDFVTFKKTVREVKSLIQHDFAGSETTLLFLWLNHFNSSLCDKCFEPRFANIFHLDRYLGNKYLYLNNIILNKPNLFKT